MRAGTRQALRARMPESWEPAQEQLDIGQVHSEKAPPFSLKVPEAVTACSPARAVLPRAQAACTVSRPARQEA
ncbi:hypothetical protein [Nonomuraea monospora]|uniref:hypothetical protein n=1 Tax=Nonomuraea monospora TaxID=568818 RepID=UPI0031D064BB